MDEQKQDTALDAAIALARLASETRCSNVVLLDVRQRSPVTKFFLIATGTSARQMRTVVDELCRAGELLGFKPWRTSGYETAKWILVDFVDVVAHIFDESSRQYYDLELLWGDSPRIQWRDPAQPESRPQDDATDAALAGVQEQLSYSFEFWEEKSDQSPVADAAEIEEISVEAAPSLGAKALENTGNQEQEDPLSEEPAPESDIVHESLEVIEIRKIAADSDAVVPEKTGGRAARRTRPAKKASGKKAPSARIKKTGGVGKSKAAAKPRAASKASSAKARGKKTALGAARKKAKAAPAAKLRSAGVGGKKRLPQIKPKKPAAAAKKSAAKSKRKRATPKSR